jgi:hypothetical protein
MTVKDMHYDFKKKANKVDSEKYRNLLIPEIDWILNEACELFVKLVLQPKSKDVSNMQVTQGTIDDIYTLIKHEQDPESVYNVISNTSYLPANYWYYLSSNVNMSRGTCTNIEGKVFIRQHGDEFEKSPFDRSSFDWRTVNAVFYDKGIRFYADDFTVDTFNISYVRRLKYIHNAEDYRDGKYILPSGVTLGVVTGGGSLEILSPVTVGSTTLTINATVIIVPIVLGTTKTVLVDNIINAINVNGVYRATRSSTKDFTISITGVLPVTILTYTGTANNVLANTNVGEGSLDCELPPHTHREIVDLAALILAGELNQESLSFKMEKMKLTFNR